MNSNTLDVRCFGTRLYITKDNNVVRTYSIYIKVFLDHDSIYTLLTLIMLKACMMVRNELQNPWTLHCSAKSTGVFESKSEKR